MGDVDLAGLAALITSVSGLIATLGALYVGSRKRSADLTEEIVQQLLERETQKLREDRKKEL